MLEVFAPSSLCVWKSNTLEKSTNKSVALKFFAQTPPMI